MSELMWSNAMGGLNQIDSDSGARRKSQNSQLDGRRQILSQGFFPIEAKRRDLGLKWQVGQVSYFNTQGQLLILRKCVKLSDYPE